MFPALIVLNKLCFCGWAFIYLHFSILHLGGFHFAAKLITDKPEVSVLQMTITVTVSRTEELEVAKNFQIIKSMLPPGQDIVPVTHKR